MHLEALLRESVDRYRTLLHLQWEMNETLKQAQAEEIVAFAGRLEAMQRQVTEVDRSLLPLLEKQWEEVAATSLFRERQALLEEYGRQVKLLLPKVEAGIAVRAAELLQIRKARVAMAGYESGSGRREYTLCREV